jgi:hypothetical protein
MRIFKELQGVVIQLQTQPDIEVQKIEEPINKKKLK